MFFIKISQKAPVAKHCDLKGRIDYISTETINIMNICMIYIRHLKLMCFSEYFLSANLFSLNTIIFCGRLIFNSEATL